MIFVLPISLVRFISSLFTMSETTYTVPLLLVHSDFWGPTPIQFSNGYCYYIYFIDAYSMFTWIYLLIRKKYDAFQIFINFKTQVELQLDQSLLSIQADWDVGILGLSLTIWKKMALLIMSFILVYTNKMVLLKESSSITWRID